ncbi:MAG: molecular chaperone DnaJ [Phycisphaeraceae bacterium]|nr:molecular chaperone DnaJ [Phycisphaeraceae bacterium]
MATQRDYYEILNLDRNAGDEDIKRAYRKLAMKHHPDRNPGDEEAERQFKEAAEAYEVLSDSNKRQRYDQFGHEGLRGTSGHDFSHMDAGDIFSMFEDIFGDFMGGGRRGRGRRRGGQRGYDLETQIELSLEEVDRGIEREVEFTRKDLCAACKGSGVKPGTEPVSCVTCGGLGAVEQMGLGGMFRMRTTCPACKGAGKIYKEKCADCRGAGNQPKRCVLQVKVPAGIHDGQSIRIQGEGEPGTAGAPRGDLYVQVRVAEHKLFSREDDHLILKMPISFTQAALGDTVEVPTLDGPTELTIKPGTQHGDLMQLHEKGLPNLRGGRRGNLVIVSMIEIPKKLTDQQRKVLSEFAETEDHQVMPQSTSFWSRIKEYLGA